MQVCVDVSKNLKNLNVGLFFFATHEKFFVDSGCKELNY